MTKKDYIKIADMMKGLPTVDKYNVNFRDLVVGLCKVFEADNPKFNRETFINYINKI